MPIDNYSLMRWYRLLDGVLRGRKSRIADVQKQARQHRADILGDPARAQVRRSRLDASSGLEAAS